MPSYPKIALQPLPLLPFATWPVLAGVVYFLWVKRESWGRPALAGLGFFVLFLAPFLGFLVAPYMTFTWVMNHFLYIPSIGLLALFMAGLDGLGRRLSPRLRQLGVGLLALAVAFMVGQSRLFAATFASPVALWSYTVRMNPGAWNAHVNLGHALFRDGQVAEAIEQFEETLQLRPDYVVARSNLGAALTQTGRATEAIAQLTEALQGHPDFTDAHYNLGNAYLVAGRLPEAVEQLEETLRQSPTLPRRTTA